MSVEEFWRSIEWFGMHTRNTCVVADSRGQETSEFERAQLLFLKEKCDKRLSELDEEGLASNRGNGSKPGEISARKNHNNSENKVRNPRSHEENTNKKCF